MVKVTWFKKIFGRYLLVTNTVSCAALMGLGDVCIQKVEQRLRKQSKESGTSELIEHLVCNYDKHDWARTARMSTMGLVMGPFNHVWYRFLDRILPFATGRMITQKILLDQVVASPFFAFTFFIGSGTLEGQGLSASLTEFRAKFWDVYKTDWMVWPAAQAFNFYFLPTQLRVIYVGGITFCWNTFLSYTKHKVRLESRTCGQEYLYQEAPDLKRPNFMLKLEAA